MTKVLTGNGKEFTDRFCATGERTPTGQHEFDQLCTAHNIDHRLIRPYRPQTNGMVERFNGRIAEVLNNTVFGSAAELAHALKRYEWLYNQHIPQKNLGHVTPMQTLKEYYQKHPELFHKRPTNLTGLDI